MPTKRGRSKPDPAALPQSIGLSWSNFHIWRKRLPHWRANDVTYYVTFRHRRDLDDWERSVLFHALLKPEGKRFELRALLVMPRVTEMIFTVLDDPDGLPYELSDIVEPAKRRAGRQIVKRTGERFPPFYEESYDRIVRDESEYLEKVQSIVRLPEQEGLIAVDGSYAYLFIASQTPNSGSG
jgi:hypothetical protein